MEEFGADHVIEVDAKQYKDQAEALRDAVRDNIAHGRPMDGITKRQFAIALFEAGDQRINQRLARVQYPCPDKRNE